MQNPEIIGELRRIAEANDGQVRPSDVVKAARPASSPLHSQFEWDDSEAAERYRLSQARQLLRVTVEYIGEGDDAVSARVFVSLTTDRGEGGYRVMADVMSNAAHRKQLLADALEEMAQFERKYSDLKKLAEVFAAMRKVRGKSRAA
jgi:hypothetical protein